MNDEEKNNLKQIKVKILDELIDLSDSEDIPPEERFSLMINRASGTTSVELFGKAHKAASQIEDTTNKARSLMDLLEEIDISLGNITVGPPPEQPQPDRPSEDKPGEEHPTEDNPQENQS